MLLAYGGPPDPFWIRGVYDGADYDDVVLLTTSEAGAAPLSLLVDVRTDAACGACSSAWNGACPDPSRFTAPVPRTSRLSPAGHN